MIMGWLLLLLLLLVAPLGAEAQQAGKVYRIGFLRNGPPPETFIEGLRKGLRELGYVEGQNISIEYGLARSADELPSAAARLVSLKVDVLLASGTPPVPVAKAATKMIPIVFALFTRICTRPCRDGRRGRFLVGSF